MPRRLGATLVETLVVTGIVGLLLALIVPAIQYARESASNLACKNNLRQIGQALHLFHHTHGKLPRLLPPTDDPSDPHYRLSWMVHLLPNLEQRDLYQRSLEACRIEADPYVNPPHVGMATVIRPYCCPTDGRVLSAMTDREGVHAAFASYIGIASVRHASDGRSFLGVLDGSFSEIRDGLSNTIAVGERPPPDSLQAGWWYPGYVADARNYRGPQTVIFLGGVSLHPEEPCMLDGRAFGPGRTDNPCDRYHLWSLHPGGANFLFADTSVRFFRYGADELIKKLASRAGHEPVDQPD